MLVAKDLLTDSISSINTNIMNFLSIDCSTEAASLFLKVQNKTFSEILQSDKYNNDLLMEQILHFLYKNDESLENINGILVNQGPGNFSGLRGSISVSKGISLAKKINLFGYNTFLLLGAKFYNNDKTIYSVIRVRKKYYIQGFFKNLVSESDPKIIEKNEIISRYKNKIVIINKENQKYIDNEVLNLKNLYTINLEYEKLEFLKKKNLLQKSLIRPIYLS